jgi:hypothetical protein
LNFLGALDNEDVHFYMERLSQSITTVVNYYATGYNNRKLFELTNFNRMVLSSRQQQQQGEEKNPLDFVNFNNIKLAR